MKNAPTDIASHSTSSAAAGADQLQPDRAVMLEHYRRRFAKLRKAYHDCMIEVLWTEPYDDDPKYRKKFSVDDVEAAVDWAVARNIERRNIFYRGIPGRRRVPAERPVS